MCYLVENKSLRNQRRFSYSTNEIILYTTTVTTIWQRREVRVPSYLVFSNFTKYLRKFFETSLNDYIWLAKRGKIYVSYIQGRRK